MISPPTNPPAVINFSWLIDHALLVQPIGTLNTESSSRRTHKFNYLRIILGGVAMGINGKLRDVEFLVPDDTLDGGAGLALIIENQGLSVEDAPTIARRAIALSR